MACSYPYDSFRIISSVLPNCDRSSDSKSNSASMTLWGMTMCVFKADDGRKNLPPNRPCPSSSHCCCCLIIAADGISFNPNCNSYYLPSFEPSWRYFGNRNRSWIFKEFRRWLVHLNVLPIPCKSGMIFSAFQHETFPLWTVIIRSHARPKAAVEASFRFFFFVAVIFDLACVPVLVLVVVLFCT